MNDPVARQLPLMDASLATRHVERPLQQRKGVVVTETDKPHSKDFAAAVHEDKGDLAEQVEQLNTQLQDMQRGLRFSVDDDSGRIVVKVIDLDTDEVIRQIPSEEMMTIIRNAGSSENFIFSDEA